MLVLNIFMAFKLSYVSYLAIRSNITDINQVTTISVPDKLVGCGVCDEVCHNNKSLARHVGFYHPDYNIEELNCNLCNQKHETAAKLFNHQRKTHLRFFCSTCNLSYSGSLNYQHEHFTLHIRNKSNQLNAASVYRKGIDPTTIDIRGILLNNLNVLQESLRRVSLDISNNSENNCANHLYFKRNYLMAIKESVQKALHELDAQNREESTNYLQQRRDHWNIVL